MEKTQQMFWFRLKPARECMFAGDAIKQLGWFYLTDSHYGIRLGEVNLFQSFCQTQNLTDASDLFLDYYYIRWLEDFFDIFRESISKMPADLFALVKTEEKRSELIFRLEKWLDTYEEDTEEQATQVYLDAIKLAWCGVLDTGFLRFKSYCRFCRFEDEIFLFYDFCDTDEQNNPVWSAKRGVCTINADVFLQQTKEMLFRFFDAMENQIVEAFALARQHPDKYQITGLKNATTPQQIFELLQEEQKKRKTQFFSQFESAVRSPVCEQEWNTIRNALQTAGIL